MKDDGRKIYQVSELNNEIKTVLENTYPDIWLEGEIAGLKTYASGHTYFYLKDSESQIAAVLFQGAGRWIKFALADGQKVIMRGRVTAYPKRGDYQLIVSYAEPAGLGALQLAFEQLKEKLRKEGLFDDSRKRSLPFLPQKIGIVTSPDGAAIKDILTVIDRRFANVEILIYPARVQGEEAKYEIAEGIEYLNEHYPELEVLLVGRGGGSYQDLWAFNEELVARAIYNSKIPVISCVGHETDFTIADFTADLRAPTPSAAAELVVGSKAELVDKLKVSEKRLSAAAAALIDSHEDRLGYIAGAKVLQKPDGLLEVKAQRLDELAGALNETLTGKISDATMAFTHRVDKLQLLSPLNVLSRGYSICRKGRASEVLRDSADVKTGDNVSIKLHRGSFDAIAGDVFGPEKN